jgi:hypothetical protein
LTESRKWSAGSLQYLLDPREPQSQWQRSRKTDTPDPIARHRGDAARILKHRFDETVAAGSKFQYIGHCLFFLGQAAIHPDFTSAIELLRCARGCKGAEFRYSGSNNLPLHVPRGDDAHRVSGTNVSVGAVLID